MAMTFSTFVTLYRQHLRARRRAPTTITWYGEQFDTYERWRVAAGLPDVLPRMTCDRRLSGGAAGAAQTGDGACQVPGAAGAVQLATAAQEDRPDENPFTLLSPEDAPHVICRRSVRIRRPMMWPVCWPALPTAPGSITGTG